MKVKLIGNKKLVTITLPQRIYGNYWITNEQNENLINIEAIDDKWVIKSNDEIKITKGEDFIDSLELIENHFYHFLDVTKDIKYRVFVGETFDSQMLLLDFNFKGENEFYIGNSSSKEDGGKPNYISYENPDIYYNQLEVTNIGGIYHIKNLHPDVNVYVNNYLVTDKYIKNGDVIFLEGLTFSIVGNTLMLGTVDNKVKYVTNLFTKHQNEKLDYSVISTINDINVDLYEDKDYFIRPPRFNQIIETKDINIDPPPGKQESENVPLILTIGPMLVMGMSSSVSGIIALTNVLSGKSTLGENIASILTAFCMLVAMIIFPTVSKQYQKGREKKKEKLRQQKYREYLQTIDKKIKDECVRQKRILIENNVSLKDVGDIILYKKRNLWERKVSHEDFLDLRLGLGNVNPKIKLNYSQEHFSLTEDNLRSELTKIVEQNKTIEDVPVTHNFKEKFISALIGKYNILRRFTDGLLLQMMAYHSYDDLKIVLFTNQLNSPYWEKLKDSPYCWNEDKTMRYYVTDMDEMLRVSAELEQIWQERHAYEVKEKKTIDYDPHYIIITDDIYLSSKAGIINDILNSESSCGFSILYLTDKLNSLPSECSSFISIDANVGGIFENELTNKKHEFIPDFSEVTIDKYIFNVSNIPIETGKTSFELPSVYSFLEMYDAGNVEQLNAFNRWHKNDPTSSLSCPVGIDENGELFKLDLHEKVHGPHGLIAGMTGSGKSEFIITYILSMAVNFHPDEVQFVLIDYKGGGLAGAFENKETGLKLPHLAGTITNLDVSEINRSLSSLQSELKRRQRIFNEARDACNESTIDIYKYQKLYREGKVKEPIAHLIIISDEFAELKSQQPDFMDELISTARIGRSLGVHLVLATQKPSGVVDEQIWSNSKFRVCLKVQDKSDSNDMIKSPDAAYLKETGRFYLQVGYNEFFAKGQSAWSGAPYYESDKRKKLVDNSLYFVDNIGSRIKSISNDKQNLRGVHKGEEIGNVLKYLADIGYNEKINVRQLWLDAIPANIFVDSLKKKYYYEKEDFVINPVIGEYDAPKEQKQSLLTLPLSAEGNSVIYGNVGSGKENLVSTIIYSLITTYSPEEVNIYVLDFGTEALRMYNKAPHIGGIISSIEKDKIKTLFTMLFNKINERKKLFADYNGSYEYYCKSSGKTVPTIVVFVNGFESFNELYTEFADDFIKLTREGQKYGIVFVATVAAASNMRIKVSQNFNNKVVLQMNDDFDYRQLLGRTELIPNKIPGRGLIKREGIYEFQSAYPTEMADIVPFINETIAKLNDEYSVRAERIPTLPEVVTTSFLLPELRSISKVPVGVEKESLNISTVDFKEQTATLICSQKIDNTRGFVKSIVYELTKLKNTGVYVIDAERLFDEKPEGVSYYSSSFEKVFESFKKVTEQLNDIYVKNDYDEKALNSYGDMVFVITGINKLKTILGTKFDTLISTPMMMSKKLSKMCYVIVDSFDNLKKVEYDLWYKDIVNSTRGIWIGNGLAEQSLFKLFASTRSVSAAIPDNFGYNIVSGIPVLIKYVTDIGEEVDEL